MTTVTRTAEHKARRGTVHVSSARSHLGWFNMIYLTPATANLCTNFELHGFTYPKNMKVKTLPWSHHSHCTRQSTWLRTAPCGHWCLRMALCTPSGACQKRRTRHNSKGVAVPTMVHLCTKLKRLALPFQTHRQYTNSPLWGQIYNFSRHTWLFININWNIMSITFLTK